MNRESVVVAMSGGVDSSVTAYLLKEKGYSVTGVTFKLLPNSFYKSGTVRNNRFPNTANNARHACEKIGIPHHVVDCAKDFKRKVIDDFLDSYRKGLTPNPCIICNNRIKFPLLLRTAQRSKAQYIATGHYARCVYNREAERFVIKDGKDKQKNQSYVLFGLNQKKLSKLILPLGSFSKEKVRALAKRLKLGSLDSRESQEICFVLDDDLPKFLRNNLGSAIREGRIKDMRAVVLGSHCGTCFYTIGQRRGLRIPYGKPIYVVDINHKAGDITVGSHKDILRKRIRVKDVQWSLPLQNNQKRLNVKVKIRYRNRKAKAVLNILSPKTCEAVFAVSQSAPAPGQAAVFYKGDTVIGGGWITK